MAVGEAGLLYRLTGQLGLYELGAGGRVDCELQSYLSGFALLAERMQALLADAFVSSCGEERLREWERLLGIPARPLSPLLLRRMAVQSRLGITPADFTPAGMEKCLAAAGVVGSVSADCAAQTLTVAVEDVVDPAVPLSDALVAVGLLMPAHLTTVFSVAGLRWTDWEAAFAAWTGFDGTGYCWQTLDTILPAELEA